MPTIDFNSDMGESFGVYRLGADREVLRHVTSANIACGFHAGDPRTIRATVHAAVEANVAIGAHPGYHDLQGFGRRPMQLSPDEIYDITVYQVGAVKAFAEACGGRLAHVKAHGALYNVAARDHDVARALCAAVRDIDRDLIFFGLSGSKLVDAAREAGLRCAQEVFADRTYQDDGALTPRGDPRAMITNVDEAVEQVMTMLECKRVRSVNGAWVDVQPDTLCIHGDQPGAAAFAAAVSGALRAAGVTIQAPGISPQA
ncbi:LamB/YcsF family protein [Caballeronia hypogeia]|uniref:5-oxoprolinase subunit A n=1 Tax=Caballeronia hypogeia TaxID=1777140 RepID=A0A158D7T0_9BURK|nr:5-oxoprolinase subunit PxpA [Caballeronia hypogeia]SAK90722.1 LamB/YcsF family protein [Caballeronia hypogeia]